MTYKRPDEWPCLSCHVVKPAAAFADGKHGCRGRTCLLCKEEMAYAMLAKHEALAAQKPQTWVNENGVKMRRCFECGDRHRLCSTFFYPVHIRHARKPYDGYERVCKKCKLEKVRASDARRRADPFLRERERKIKQAATAKERMENPERVKAQRKRHWQRVKSDPARYAKARQDARMYHRLRRERQGLPVKPVRPAMRDGTGHVTVPSAPLAVMIEREVELRNAVFQLGMPSDEKRADAAATFEAVCRELDVSSTTVRAWRRGARPVVNVARAESVLLLADKQWSDVYSYDDHAAAFLAEPVEVGA